MRISSLSLILTASTHCLHASTEENIAPTAGTTTEETTSATPTVEENEFHIPTIESLSDEIQDDEPRCSESDFNLWRGNMQFTLDLSDISFRGLGMEFIVGPALMQKYPSLSATCLPCFTTAAACGRDTCGLDCLINRFGLKCLDCNTRYCTPAFRACIGAKIDWDMPPQPTVDDAPSTTVAPKKIRTRKQVSVSDSSTQEQTPATTTNFATIEEVPPSWRHADTLPGVAAAATVVVALFALVYAKMYR